MSISREKPAAKRPRSYMAGPCGRKLSIMSTVFAQHPSQKSKEQALGFLGGTQGRIKARIMSISRALGQKSQPPNALEATWKDPVAEKQAAKRRRKCIWKDASRSCIPQERGDRARAPPLLRGGCPLRLRDSFYISIYLDLLIYPSILYIYTYIYLYLSLSLFEQVKLLEKA